MGIGVQVTFDKKGNIDRILKLNGQSILAIWESPEALSGFQVFADIGENLVINLFALKLIDEDKNTDIKIIYSSKEPDIYEFEIDGEVLGLSPYGDPICRLI